MDEMGRVDILAAVCAAAITLAFYLVGARLRLFAAWSAVVIALTAATAWGVSADGGWTNAALCVLGAALYAFGLLIVRVMLRRSVSLHLLAGYLPEETSADIGAEIRSRLADAEAFYLVSRSRGDDYRLTAFGRLVAGVVRLLYWLTRTA